MPYRSKMPKWKIERAKAMRAAPTRPEAKLLNALRKVCPHRVRSQAPMLGYIVDLYVPAARLVIEIDGASHAGRREYDATRDAALRAKGIDTIRVTNRLVLKDCGHCADWLLSEIEARVTDRDDAREARQEQRTAATLERIRKANAERQARQRPQGLASAQ